MNKENLLKAASVFGLGATLGLYAHGVLNDAKCENDRFTWDDKVSICETPEGRIEATNREGQRVVFPKSVDSLYQVWHTGNEMVYCVYNHHEMYYTEVFVHTIDFNSGEDKMVYWFQNYY